MSNSDSNSDSKDRIMMAPMKKRLLLIAAALAVAVATPALAQPHGAHGYYRPGGYYGPHSSVRFGVYLGGPWYGWPGYYYAPPYYYYPPTVVTVPVTPPTYVEQAPAMIPSAPSVPSAPPASAAPQPGYWYYCADARGYYPYVKECPAGWQRVAPQPPG